MRVQWVQCQGGVWCGFRSVKLETVNAAGVYVIWHGGNPARTVKVGQSLNISNRLGQLRHDQNIAYYERLGTLYVTWAAVASHQMDGVERYLGDYLRPLVGDVFPNAQPIAVNAPW